MDMRSLDMALAEFAKLLADTIQPGMTDKQRRELAVSILIEAAGVMADRAEANKARA
jgi:hypothetical protein